LEVEDLKVLVEVRAGLQVDWEVFVTVPAPLMLADLASHVRAPSLLFYPYKAVLASTYFFLGVSPGLVLFVELGFTSFSRVWRVQAREASFFLTKGAIHDVILVRLGRLLKVAFTVGSGTELQVRVSVYFIALIELQVLLIQLLTHQMLLHIFD